MNDRKDDRSPDGTFPSPAALREVLKRGDRLLGVDLGSKTIGLAVSDGLWMTANPLQTIRRSKFAKDSACLLEVIVQQDAAALVIGWPVEMDGSEGKRCQSTAQFIANLRGLGGRLESIPVARWDERLSTSAVQRMMIDDFDLSRRKRAETVDRAAAAYILQGFLDALTHLS